MMRLKRPLWTCPRCGHQFITPNMWHSCGRWRLADHFAGKPRVIRQLFNRLCKVVRECGPVTIYAQKTRIVFQVRVRFGGVIARYHWLEAGLWLERRAQHPTLQRVQPFAAYNSHGYGHFFRLTALNQLDDDFAAFVREAYAVGCQTSRTDQVANA